MIRTMARGEVCMDDGVTRQNKELPNLFIEEVGQLMGWGGDARFVRRDLVMTAGA